MRKTKEKEKPDVQQEIDYLSRLAGVPRFDFRHEIMSANVSVPSICVLAILDFIVAAYQSSPDGVDVSNAIAYFITGNQDHLQIVDVSDPSNLSVIADYELNTGLFTVNQRLPVAIRVAGNFAYILNVDIALNCYFAIYDVSDPLVMLQTGSLLLAAGSLNGERKQIALSGIYAFVPFNDDIKVIDISNPAAPTLAASIPVAIILNDFALGCFIDPDTPTVLYATAFADNRFRAYDITNPLAATSIFNSVTTGSPTGFTRTVYVSNNLAAVCWQKPGSTGLDFFNATTGALLGSFATGGEKTEGVWLNSDNTRAVVIVGNAVPNFKILNISDLSSISIADTLPVPSDYFDAQVLNVLDGIGYVGGRGGDASIHASLSTVELCLT